MVRTARRVLIALAMLFSITGAGGPAQAGGLERGERARVERHRSTPAARPRQVRHAHKSHTSRSTRSAQAKSRARSTQATVVARKARAQSVPAQAPVLEPGRSPAPSVGDANTTATPFDIVQLATLRPVFLRPVFRRPSAVPPNSSRRDEIALGERLFFEPKLSSDHKTSCATCHEPERAFTDGRITARGDKGQALPRNTPPLWNLAWQKRFYWDARADTLEAQVKDAIEREGEMDGTLQAAAYWLSQDAAYVAAFQRAYGTSVIDTPNLIPKAIAAYERTLVSPETRFDRWAAGDDRALAPEELAGLRIFTGKGRCLACHGGWRLTDDDVHDIGLRSTDRGAAALPGSKTAGRAFKTPSLREIGWTGPYMHDGSLMTLDDVLDHYTRRLDRRASLAPELRAPLMLSLAERRDLLAFLRTLSSERVPRAP